jgi:hypothetical protein
MIPLDELEAVAQEAEAAAMPCPEARPLFAIPTPPKDNPDELLGNAFLCRGGGVLLCGPTGIGKSVFNLQCAMSWALNRPAFGIESKRALKSLVIQSENDDSDLTRMRDGIALGLRLTPGEQAEVSERVLVVTEDARAGIPFFLEVVRPLCGKFGPDLLWIDPLLTYLGGDASSQREVSPWLRNWLTPTIREFRCGVILAHHTNKPASGREKPDWKAGDFAYLGTGSAEFANWARGVLAIRSIGSHQVFELHAGKRGARIGWKDEDGSPAFMRHIAHSTDGTIFWRAPHPEEVPTQGRPVQYNGKDLLDLLPPAGLATEEWRAQAEGELGISRPSFYRLSKELKENGKVFRLISGKWSPKP